jgi:hypothetical protein
MEINIFFFCVAEKKKKQMPRNVLFVINVFACAETLMSFYKFKIAVKCLRPIDK